jgi:hypothetical protein
MAPHVHIGVVEFFTVVAYILIFTFLWRALTGALTEKHPTAAGALAGAYS